MKYELRELLSRYVDNNMFADYNFVQEVIKIFVNRYGNHGLKRVMLITEKQKGISDFEHGIIGINLDYIKRELMICDCYDDEKSNLYLFNVSVILILKHEFNHFRQILRYKNVINSEDFLDRLFVNSFIMTCFSNMELINIFNDTDCTTNKEINKIYDDYHDCFAVERLAQIDAYRSIVEIITSLKDDMKQVYYYFLYEYYFYKVKDYCLIDDIILSPIDKILFQMDDCFQYKDNLFIDNAYEVDVDLFYDSMINDYNIYDRFRYGLPITVLEYKNTLDFAKVMYMLSTSSDVKKKKRYYDGRLLTS